MNNRYHGKRFFSLLVVTGLLTVAYFMPQPDMFASYSTTLGLLYGAYLAGQSATDYQKAKTA